jgi:primosomal protein N' (replication factor Y)
MLDIPIVLGSATPSLDTLHNLGKSHFHHHRLTRRPGAAVAPQIRLIDSSKVNLNDGCSPQLLQAMRQHLDQCGQVLLFLNRRGFAPVVRCHSCGWDAMCHQCDARMTLHQSINRLICHHCGHTVALPASCPDCAQPEIRHYGIGTERLQQFLQSHFTETPVIRVDRDSVSDAAQMHKLLQPVRDGEPCILLGTQMIAKGHDYPNITLVGIIDADQALHSGFYRAGERLVQTVLQVAGRAGRAERPGLALLQTAFPEHELMRNLCRQDYAALVQPLLDERKLLGFPPFARVVTLVADALELDPALQRLQAIHDAFIALPNRAGVRAVGPIPALMTRRIGRYRAQLSLLADDARALRQVLNALLPEIQRVRNSQRLRLVVEVDPLDL